MSNGKDKPQIEFIVSLHKIKDAYFRYDLGDKSYKEVETLISFYEEKPNYSDNDLRRLQLKSEMAWQDLLKRICDTIISKIEKSKNKQKIYSKELRQARMAKEKINFDLKLGDYESMFTGEIEPLKLEFDSKCEKDKMEWKRFWLGILIGVIISIIFGAIFKHFGMF